MSKKIEELLDAIGSLTVMEAAELKEAMEEKFGVSAAAPVVAAGAAPGAGAAEAAEEKDEFDVVLQDVGGKKIQVIKALREVTNLGLKEAKELVDGAPSTIREAATKDEADQIKGKLEEQGATVELQ